MIYKLKTDNIEDDWIKLNDNCFPFKAWIASGNSDFEKLSKIYKNDIIEISTSKEGGLNFPDVFYDNFVLLVSENIYRILKRLNTPFFERKVIIHDEILEADKLYYLIVPPRIDCIEGDRINKNKILKYDIFKIKGYDDNEIYISEKLKKLINNFKGIFFMPVNISKCYEYCYDKINSFNESFLKGYYQALLEFNSL